MCSKILIVEDEEVLAEMYRERFEAEGVEVDVSSSAEDALSYLDDKLPDVVLLDILLPRESGITLLEQMQERELNVPVVAFSNYDEEGTKKRAFQLGAEEYLIKTEYTPAEIVERVKPYLQK